MLNKGESVSYDLRAQKQGLPENYFQAFLNLKKAPRILFISGEHNHIFPGSNLCTYQNIRSSNSKLDVQFWQVPGYGHQDTFMGKNVAEEVFPTFWKFLRGESVL